VTLVPDGDLTRVQIAARGRSRRNDRSSRQRLLEAWARTMMDRFYACVLAMQVGWSGDIGSGCRGGRVPVRFGVSRFGVRGVSGFGASGSREPVS
jgi:hypothetical protein